MVPSWLPLPSLLPSNLQKHLLSYALTHVLGTFLEPQSFSLENLELQLLNGTVSLRNLDLNASKLNGILRIPGIEIISGSIGRVTVQIPVRDILSGRISVIINGIHVMVQPSEKATISPEPVPDLTPDSLAQSFLHTSLHDPTDSVLFDTLSESIHSSDELGLGPAEEEGMFTNILAAFVDALTSRLVIEIEDISVHVQHPRSGAFVLTMTRISFYPRDENIAEKVLCMRGIEAYLQPQNFDTQSMTSEATITSPSPRGPNSPAAEDDHLLSQSMMFSAQEASSLYMSAYSHPSQSRYLDEPAEEPPSGHVSLPTKTEDKGFRFFYFEKDLVFHVTSVSDQPDPALISTTPTRRSHPPPVLQSAIPTANLILNPDVNLLPSISIIATILSLSPSTSDSPPANSSSRSPSGGLDFSWLGGVVIHFGAEDEETIARFADWKVMKKVGDEPLTISMALVEVVTSTGEKILCTKNSVQTPSSPLTLTLNASGIDIWLPEVDLRIDLERLLSLQPLFNAIEQAWLDSVPAGVSNTRSMAGSAAVLRPENPEEYSEEYIEEDDDWNENLLVEKPPAPTPGNSRPLRFTLHRLNLILPNNKANAEDLTFSMSDFSVRLVSSGHISIDFATAQLSVSSTPLLSLSSPSAVRAMIDFVSSDKSSLPRHVRIAQMSEILEDFLIGEGNRSDDAWGIIRTDAMDETTMVVKIRLPRVEVNISGAEELRSIRSFIKRLEEMLAAFAAPQVRKPKKKMGRTEMVLEFAVGEGMVQLELSESEQLEGQWEGFEGTIVRGIADEDTAGVIDITKLSLRLESPTPRKIVHESIYRGNDSTPCLGLKFVQSRERQFTCRVGLYNLNFEYFVINPWVEKLSQLFLSEPCETENPVISSTLSFPPPAQFGISLSDCTVGLNPLNLPSRGLLLITSTTIRGEWDFQKGGRGKFDVSINKAHLFCIDIASDLLPPPRQTRLRFSGRKEILGYFTDLGYALCATMPTGNATIRFLLPEVRLEIDVEDVGLQLDTCADSTQTLGDMFNDLKLPLEQDEGRYYSAGSESINVLQDIDENAFGGSFTSKEAMVQDEDLVLDDVPFNLAFVESYYGDQSRIKSSPSNSRNEMTEEEGDELLAEGEDIGHFAEPPKPAGPVDKGTFGEFEEQIRVFDNSSISDGSNSVRFVEEHFPSHFILQENAFLSSDSLIRLRLGNTRVVWNLHDGYDWPKTRDAIALAVQKVEQRAAEALAAKTRRKTPQPTRTVTLPEVLYGDDPWTFDEDEEEDIDDDSEIGDILFNSIYVGVRRGQDPRTLARNINRDLGDLDAQSETTSQVSTTPSSPMRSSRGASPGFASGNMLDRTRRSVKSLRLKRSKSQKVQVNLRNLGIDFDLLPDPVQPGDTVLSTIRLKVGDLEILDNVPTSSWNKFVTFWWGGDKRRETASAMVDLEIANVKPVQHLSASELVIKAKVLPLKLHVDQDTLDFITRFFEFKDHTAVGGGTIVPEPPFIQRVEVYPVKVMLDYKPKKVDYVGLRSGRTTEFMNFFTLEEAEILLRRITLYGISGYPRLFQKLNDIWMPDIRGNQLLDVLGGINYVRPFANIGGGVKDLILVPMKEYRKDGRILQGTGKGVINFGKTLTNELVKVGAKMAVGAQKGLEWGEGLIEGKSATLPREGVRFDDGELDEDMESDPRIVTLSPYADQPANIKQGIKRAIESLVRNAKSASETVIAIPQEVAESGSAAGAGKTVLKAIPVAIIRPLIGASGAVSNTLMGIHNTLDSNQQRNIEDKYKR